MNPKKRISVLFIGLLCLVTSCHKEPEVPETHPTGALLETGFVRQPSSGTIALNDTIFQYSRIECYYYENARNNILLELRDTISNNWVWFHLFASNPSRSEFLKPGIHDLWRFECGWNIAGNDPSYWQNVTGTSPLVFSWENIAIDSNRHMIGKGTIEIKDTLQIQGNVIYLPSQTITFEFKQQE